MNEHAPPSLVSSTERWVLSCSPLLPTAQRVPVPFHTASATLLKMALFLPPPLGRSQAHLISPLDNSQAPACSSQLPGFSLSKLNPCLYGAGASLSGLKISGANEMYTPDLDPHHLPLSSDSLFLCQVEHLIPSSPLHKPLPLPQMPWQPPPYFCPTWFPLLGWHSY